MGDASIIDSQLILIKYKAMPFTRFIHPDGFLFIGIFAFLTFILSLFSANLGWVGLVLTGWCIYFFRTPPRVTPVREGLIISSADGKVVDIKKVIPPDVLDMGSYPRTRVSIFLNVFDVHANRIPVDGTVKKVVYHPGQFVNASFDKASDLNERNTVVIEMKDGQKMAVVQIAGLIARRIRCDVDFDDEVRVGEIYGIIRFGSRVDLYLPVGVESLVIEGQRTIAGETVIADMSSTEGLRMGEVR